MKTKITIIGGGIAGLTTAIALQKIGFDVIVFEAAPALKEVGSGLSLGANAMLAFKKLGIMEEVMLKGKQLPSFSLLDEKGNLINRTETENWIKLYGADNFTIHRATLHQLLYSKCNKQSVYVNKRVIDIEQKKGEITLTFQDGTVHTTDYVIAADGINSPVRKKVVPNTQLRYAGYTCWRGVMKNSEIPIFESSETWGVKGRIGILPLTDDRIYWFACTNSKQNDAQFKNFKSKEIAEHFKDFHQPIPSIISQTKDEDILWNDVSDLEPIHQYAYGNILLIGDAAHASTPNLGQGACQAIEDAIVLADEICKQPNIISAFKQFEKRRIKRTHFIVNSSRRLGEIGQWENKWLIWIRNFIFRHTPKSINDKQLEKIYSVDF
jgi:2-polyprenyl-6-methoxyphenol hydroxylase-like FAD-dependent oxidoreductase